MSRSILFLAVLISLSCKAQETNSPPDVQVPVKKETIIVKWAPTALLGFHPALQFAAEFFYSPKRAFQVEYGWLNPSFDANELAPSDYRGHRFRIEHRHYFSNKRLLYFAPELSVQRFKFSMSDLFGTWVVDPATNTGDYENTHRAAVAIRKVIATANFKTGIEFKVLNRVVMNLYCGLGLRCLNNKWLTDPGGEPVIIDPGFSPFAPASGIGTRYMFNVAGGVQIGYRIR